MQLQRGLSASVSAAETRLESSAGTPGHSEKKLESRTSQQAEDIARDSFFLRGRRSGRRVIDMNG